MKGIILRYLDIQKKKTTFGTTYFDKEKQLFEYTKKQLKNNNKKS